MLREPVETDRLRSGIHSEILISDPRHKCHAGAWMTRSLILTDHPQRHFYC